MAHPNRLKFLNLCGSDSVRRLKPDVFLNKSNILCLDIWDGTTLIKTDVGSVIEVEPVNEISDFSSGIFSDF